jgi:hypothetical protein
MLRAQSSRIEADRRLGDDVSSALARAGLFRMAVPKSAGGPEHTPREIIEAIEAVAMADAAAGWCVGIGATTSLVGGYLPIESAREMFADPMQPACGVFAPMGKGVRESGGFRVKGRWSFASGCDHSEWRLVGFMVEDVVKRPFITVGMAVFVILFLLTITSNRLAIRSLGRRWQSLHRLVYAAAIGGVIHFWWLVKADITLPRRWAVTVAVLLGIRMWWAFRKRMSSAS